MTRVAVYSRSDAFHRDIAIAARQAGDLSIELRIRSEREFRTPGNLDVIIIHESNVDTINRLIEKCRPLPVVLVDLDEPSAGWDYLADRLDGWARVTNDDPARVLIAARAAAVGLIVGERSDAVSDSVATPPAFAPDPTDRSGSELTSREREVLELLARGKTNASIAVALGVSPNTIKYHLSGLFAKLEVGSRSEATWQAVRRGIISI